MQAEPRGQRVATITGGGLLWLGPIPKKRVCQRGTPAHVILQHHKGGWIQECGFTVKGGACVLPTCSSKVLFLPRSPGRLAFRIRLSRIGARRGVVLAEMDCVQPDELDGCRG